MLLAVIDDDSAARESLARLLELEGFTVDGFPSALAFLSNDPPREYSCLIVDLKMPGMTGLELQVALNTRGRTPPIVFLTAFGTVPESVRAMRGGAVDFLEKPVDVATMLDAVTRGIERDHCFRSQQRARNEAASRLEELTLRERDVFDRVILGYPNKKIAEELGIALKTVKVHRGRVMAKTGAESVAELVRLAAAASGASVAAEPIPSR